MIPVQNANILRDLNLSSTLEILPDVGRGYFWEKPKGPAEAIVEFLSSVPAPVQVPKARRTTSGSAGSSPGAQSPSPSRSRRWCAPPGSA